MAKDTVQKSVYMPRALDEKVKRLAEQNDRSYAKQLARLVGNGLLVEERGIYTTELPNGQQAEGQQER